MSGADRSLAPLLAPRSIAVVGASRRPRAVGRRLLDALIRTGFRGPVYPVNAKAEHVGPHPAFPSLERIGRPVDLAVVAVPSESVIDVAHDAGDAGVKGLIVISAGFAETGEEGAARQRELLDVAAEGGMRVIGPNCLGVITTDPEIRMNASFAPEPPPRGRVAFCSQSGALGIAMISSARRAGLGLASMVSIGNGADVGVVDLVEAWEADPDISVITLYLESFSEPRRLADVVRTMDGSTPVVAVKAGRTSAGSRAAASHTASVAGADSAVEALIREAGIIRVDTVDEMFAVARFLDEQPLPGGRRVAIATNSGGPGILCADALTSEGMSVPQLPEETQRRLAEGLPPEASTANPVDMIASATEEEYRHVVKVLAGGEGADALVAIYTEIEVADIRQVHRAVCEEATTGEGSIPVVAVYMGSEEDALASGDDAAGVPAYTSPEMAATILALAARHSERMQAGNGAVPRPADLDIEKVRSAVDEAAETADSGWLDPVAARLVLATAGVPVPPHRRASTEEEAARAAEEISGAVAVAVISPDIVHKSEMSGIELGIEGSEGARRAFRRIRDRTADVGARFDGVLVQPMLEGTEVLVGVDRDPRFGPLMAFGLGGVLVEVLGDVAFRLAPLTERQARAMIHEIKAIELLTGFRNVPAADLASLEDLLIRLSLVAHEIPQVQELDLNPVFAGPDGSLVGDVRIRVVTSAERE